MKLQSAWEDSSQRIVPCRGGYFLHAFSAATHWQQVHCICSGSLEKSLYPCYFRDL